jgi:hypothetical protein
MENERDTFQNQSTMDKVEVVSSKIINEHVSADFFTFRENVPIFKF